MGRNTSTTTCAGTTSTAYNNSTGRVTSRTDAENRTTTYTYDAMGRKLTTTYPDSNVRNYSNVHELTSVAGTSQTFDNDGNLTAAHTGAGLSWNDANRTSGSTLGTLTTTYKHDASGVRVSKKVVDGSTTTVDTVYVHAGPNCIAEYNYSAASSSPAMEYVYAQEIDSLALIARNNNAQKLIVTRNQQWSVVSLCDNANGDVLERYTYDQFGKRKILAPDGSTVRTTSSYDNSWGYTSRYHDAESGFMYFRARYYDPSTGEFTSRDPLEYVDGLSVYRGYYVPRDQDSAGTIKRIDFEEFNETDDVCDNTEDSGVKWKWQLDKPAHFRGYIIQRVEFTCKECECHVFCRMCSETLNCRERGPFVYYEAFLVDGTRDAPADRAASEDFHTIHGKAFKCFTTNRKLEARFLKLDGDIADYDGWTDRDGVEYGVDSCRLTPVNLPHTGDENPALWQRAMRQTRLGLHHLAGEPKHGETIVRSKLTLKGTCCDGDHDGGTYLDE